MKCSELTKGNTLSHKVTDELVRTCRQKFNRDQRRYRFQKRNRTTSPGADLFLPCMKVKATSLLRQKQGSLHDTPKGEKSAS